MNIPSAVRFLLMAVSCAGVVDVADAAGDSSPWPLWPEAAPGALGTEPADIPTLTTYAPAAGQASGASLLILPGGGYGALAGHEGEGFAQWLRAQGVTCYVLKYRLGSRGYRHPVMLQDAARGLRTVRAWARRAGLDPARVGIMGSSAGGHLAATLLTHFDGGAPTATDPIERESSRPDLGILCYPVITLGKFTHTGSRNNLLGPTPSPELLQNLSNELQVTAQTPPCFVWHCFGDQAVPVENSLLFVEALSRAGVAAELHVYAQDGHGQGLPAMKKGAPAWDEPCLSWLRKMQFIAAAAP